MASNATSSAAVTGMAMVFHDWDLDRLTAEKGPLIERSAAQLGRIRISSAARTRSPPCASCSITIAGRVPLLIEVKARPSSRIPAHLPCGSAHARRVSGRGGRDELRPARAALVRTPFAAMWCAAWS